MLGVGYTPQGAGLTPAQAAQLSSIAGGAYWEPFGPPNVQVDDVISAGVTVFDPGGGIIAVGDITPGTYTLVRIRAGVSTTIVNGAASSKAAGSVYASATFAAANWQLGDVYVFTFSGIVISISGESTSLPPIQVYGRVVTEPDIYSLATTINTNQGNPAAQTLTSTTAKLGNLARALNVIIGARWDTTSDLGTDIASIIAYVDGLEAAVGAIEGATTLHNKLTATRAGYLDLLADGTVGLAVLKAYVDEIETRLTAARAGYLDNLSAGAVAQQTSVDDLETRLTAARAGYLDNLSAGAVAQAGTALTNVTWTDARAGYLDELAAANIPADVDELKTSKGRVLCSLDFWSASQEEVQLTNVAGDKALPSVTVADLPAGATVVRAIAMFKFRAVENTNAGVNKLNGAQDIQVRVDTPGAYTDAINFVDDQFTLAASTREGGDVYFGNIDLAATITGNDGYEFQWDEAVVDAANLQFNDVQIGIRIWFSI